MLEIFKALWSQSTDKQKEQIINYIKGEEKASPRFKKPELSEVKAYCESRSNTVDVESWFNYYESKGWKIGKAPMKDWKAAVRTWENRNEANSRNQNKPFDSAEYVLDKIERGDW